MNVRIALSCKEGGSALFYPKWTDDMETVGYAPAKINLGLRVLRRRPDGFHDIESVLMSVPWFDIVEFEFGTSFSFSCTDERLPTDEGNLCVRAVRAFEHRFDFAVDAHVHLVKSIPFGAGLGGGSSDAATVLRVLAQHYEHGTSEELLEIAIGLGSDVPFFLGKPVQLARGRGEVLEPIGRELFRFPFELVIAVPDVFIDTAQAYAGVTPEERVSPDLVEVLASTDLSRWRDGLVNDFERTVLSDFPQLFRIKGMLYDGGAGYASLSGSGSAMYGVFEDDEAALEAAKVVAEFARVVWIGSAREGRVISDTA